MEAALQLQLNEQPEIRELLPVLKGNGVEKECLEVEAVVSYLVSMENRFEQVMNELKEIKGHIPQVQNKSIKDKASEIVGASEKWVGEVRNKLQETKETIKGRVKDTLAEFRESGIQALQKAVTLLKIPEILQGLEKIFHRGIESADRSAEKIFAVRNELNAIGVHARNLGGIFMGKEVRQDNFAAPDRGILFKIESAYRSISKVFSTMEQKTAQIRKRLEQFLAQGHERPSVRAELNRLKNESEKNAAENKAPQKDASIQEKHKQDVVR